MIYFGDTKIGKLYLGSTPIGKAYLGGNLVYQSGPAGFAVTYNLTGVTSSNTARRVLGPYTTTLTATDSTFTIWTVSVTMDGTDITSTAYSNGVITIADVTGAVFITAYAALLPPQYTRLQYILNSNNTYINTGVYLSSDDHVIFEYNTSMASGAGNRYLFGDDTTTGKKFFAFSYYPATASPRFGYAALSTRYLTSGRIEVLNHVWSFGGTEDTYDGTYNGNAQNFVCTQPCCLFNNPSKGNAKHDFGISHFFVEGKFDGYACINSEDEVGIYDFQTNSFFKSPENIAFVAGPVA